MPVVEKLIGDTVNLKLRYRRVQNERKDSWLNFAEAAWQLLLPFDTDEFNSQQIHLEWPC
jgi:hypothetical protein